MFFGVLPSSGSVHLKLWSENFNPKITICILNVSTKVLTNRLTTVANRLTKPSQSAFLPGRYIVEGVVVLHETIHELKRMKQSEIILKPGRYILRAHDAAIPYSV
jgi:hypothetical protein